MVVIGAFVASQAKPVNVVSVVSLVELLNLNICQDIKGKVLSRLRKAEFWSRY